MAKARYERSPAELEMYQIASGIATEAMRASSTIRPGVRELELAAEADHVMKQLGAYSYGLTPSSVPAEDQYNHREVIESGDRRRRTRDVRSKPSYEGYTSAIGRTVVAGTASPEQSEFLDRGSRATTELPKSLERSRPKPLTERLANI